MSTKPREQPDVSPCIIYYSLFPVQDYKRLLRELPNLVDNYTIPWRKYTHSDFQYAIDNDKLLFPRLLSNMAAAEENQETV